MNSGTGAKSSVPGGLTWPRVAPCDPVAPQVYQDLCKKHPTFRERSERVDLSVGGGLSRRRNEWRTQKQEVLQG